MPLLQACLDKKVRLVDYECITAGGKVNGKRLIAFGAWAGRAGMINGLRGLGERLLAQGYSTPFLNMASSYMYSSFEEARRGVLQVGESLRKPPKSSSEVRGSFLEPIIASTSMAGPKSRQAVRSRCSRAGCSKLSWSKSGGELSLNR